MTSKRRRIEALERRAGKERGSAGRGTYRIPPEVELYLKHVENVRRERAGESPIPLTPEEERWERETDNDPEFRAYLEEVSKQREERIWREGT